MENLGASISGPTLKRKLKSMLKNRWARGESVIISWLSSCLSLMPSTHPNRHEPTKELMNLSSHCKVSNLNVFTDSTFGTYSMNPCSVPHGNTRYVSTEIGSLLPLHTLFM